MSVPNKTSYIFEAKPYKCLIEGCNASYKKPSMLIDHSRKHTGERPFKCDVPGCSLSYTNIAHLRRHKCVVHEKSCEVICEEKGCGRVLNNKYALKKHYNQIHNPAKNAYNCAKCSESFKKKRQLRQHLYLHTEGVPFKCSICNIVFSKPHLYNKHNRNHKTYTCDCGVEFNRWTLFCEHRRTSCTVKNIVHECIICKKVFTTGTHLKCHTLTHLSESQEDVYRCPYINCRKTYKYKKNLTSHITIFHEKCDLSVQCTVPGCQKVLKSKRILENHIIKIHGGLPQKIKERKRRRDKGKSKICMASTMSGVEMSLKEHLAVMTESKTDHSSLAQKSNVHRCGRIQQSCDEVVKDVGSTSLNDTMSCNINISCTSIDMKVSNKHLRNEGKEKEWEPETEVPNLQVQMGVEYTAQNMCSKDEVLNYCDDVLKTLQEHLGKVPSTSSSLVY